MRPDEAPALRDVGAVVNALRILQFLAASTAPVGVAAVARGTRISTSTCFNILRTLARARFVSFHQVAKTYTLGLAMAELAAGMVGVSHAELIRPELERLALNYETLVLLWRVTEDNHLVLIDRAHSQATIRVEIGIGYRLPLLVGAIGRCAAAVLCLPEADLRRRFAGLRWQSPPTFSTYQAEVALRPSGAGRSTTDSSTAAWSRWRRSSPTIAGVRASGRVACPSPGSKPPTGWSSSATTSARSPPWSGHRCFRAGPCLSNDRLSNDLSTC